MRNTILFLLLTFGLSGCELDHKDISKAETIDKNKLLDMVNELRESGCDCGGTYMPPAKKIEWDYQLERAAIAHSIDMSVQGYFSHTSLDGASYADRINGTDYSGNPAGENIAVGYGSEEAVFNGWRNSPGHCQNMMNSGHKDIAVGRSGSYWTMNFGRK
ncbi:MAG: CAP domain-containing protein [Bacteroidetes bacterium]|nr:MAG: CAP domain-containing protein [Bacteroidota bacterium]